MGIARALERVKQQAKQGGLNAVIVGLGEELRSSAIPAPLRGAAQRIAALLERDRPATPAESGTQTHAPASAASAHAQAEVLAPEQSPEQKIDAGLDGVTARGPSAAAPTMGTDSGAVPVEPPADTPVDAKLVGATPSYEATPLDATPLDATPLAVSPVDATPAEMAPEDEAEPRAGRASHVAPMGESAADIEESSAEPPTEPRVRSDALPRTRSAEAEANEGEFGDEDVSPNRESEPVLMAAVIEDVREEDVSSLDDEITLTGPMPQHNAPTVPSPAPALTVPSPAPLTASEPKRPARPRAPRPRKGSAPSVPNLPASDKEKLAADGEAAKTLARSSSRSAKKRPGNKGDTTSKKK